MSAIDPKRTWICFALHIEAALRNLATSNSCEYGWLHAIVKPMAPRKDKPTYPKKGQQGSLRFTPADIVRAIAGVEAAGLQVFGIEITPTGAIKISTGPCAEASANEAKRESLAETLPTKKNKQA
jgi:hypothetical protein